jgi:lipoprotein-releasing system permease protein
LGGIFAVQQDFDSKYILAPLSFARQIMSEERSISAVEIKLQTNANATASQKWLNEKLGDSYRIKTRYQQNETLYKVMRTEKWVVFAILSFIILIAAFNIIGSLSMLVIEKKADIATLRAMGADQSLIQRIFLYEGLQMSLLGSFIGLLVGGVVCWIQDVVGVIPMPGSTFLIQYYPVDLQLTDFLLVGLITVLISALMAWLPAHRAVQGLEHAVPGKV